MKPLNRAQQKVLRVVKDNPYIRPKELYKKIDLAPKTIRSALRGLKNRKLVKSFPDPCLMDMRRYVYVAT